jgi:hypothetical protein
VVCGSGRTLRILVSRSERVASELVNLLQCRNLIIVIKNLVVVTKVFAFLNLLFVPSIAVLLIIAFTGSGPWWFTFLGLPALFINVWIIASARLRKRIWNKASAIAGQTPAASHKG